MEIIFEKVYKKTIAAAGACSYRHHFLSFVLVNMSNTDAIDMLEANRGMAMTEVEKQELREELGLNKPVITRYFIWLKNTFTGDMGNSYVSGKPVFSTFVSKLPATVYLCVVSMALTLIISVPLGIISAVNKISGWIIL